MGSKRRDRARLWLFMLVGALTPLVGCGVQEEPNGVVEEPCATIALVPASEVPRFPLGVSLMIGDNCDRVPVEGCLWALSHDTVVYGKVVDLRLLEEPLYHTNLAPFQNEEVDDPSVCDRIVPIFEVDVCVEQWAGVEPPAVVTIRMGHYQYGGFWPFPKKGPSGEVVWERTESPVAGRAFEVGQELGAGIHYHPELERWSLAQDTLFAPMLDSEGREIIGFQPAGPNPCEGPPLEWNGLSVAELFASIAACPDNPEATVRHDRYHESAWWLDAYCDIDPIPPTPCQSDADCNGPEEVCSSWNQVCEPSPLNP